MALEETQAPESSDSEEPAPSWSGDFQIVEVWNDTAYLRLSSDEESKQAARVPTETELAEQHPAVWETSVDVQAMDGLSIGDTAPLYASGHADPQSCTVEEFVILSRGLSHRCGGEDEIYAQKGCDNSRSAKLRCSDPVSWGIVSKSALDLARPGSEASQAKGRDQATVEGSDIWKATRAEALEHWDITTEFTTQGFVYQGAIYKILSGWMYEGPGLGPEDLTGPICSVVYDMSTYIRGIVEA